MLTRFLRTDRLFASRLTRGAKSSQYICLASPNTFGIRSVSSQGAPSMATSQRNLFFGFRRACRAPIAKLPASKGCPLSKTVFALLNAMTLCVVSATRFASRAGWFISRTRMFGGSVREPGRESSSIASTTELGNLPPSIVPQEPQNYAFRALGSGRTLSKYSVTPTYALHRTRSVSSPGNEGVAPTRIRNYRRGSSIDEPDAKTRINARDSNPNVSCEKHFLAGGIPLSGLSFAPGGFPRPMPRACCM